MSQISTNADFDFSHEAFIAREQEAVADVSLMRLAKEALALAKMEGLASTCPSLPASIYGDNDSHNVHIERLEFFVGRCTGTRSGMVGYLDHEEIQSIAARVIRRTVRHANNGQ